MPYANRTRTDFIYRRQKRGVKIGSCAPTFCPIKNGTFPSDNFYAIKKSDHVR